MATDTRVLISKAPYSDGYEARVRWNGSLELYRFMDQHELAAKLAGDCVDDRTIEAAIDAFDSLEWREPSPSVPAVVDPTDLAFEAFMYRTERDMWKWNFAAAIVAVGILGLVAGILAWRAGA